MKVLVVGGGGQVGRAVIASAPRQYVVQACLRSDVDLSCEASVDKLLADAKPSWIINAAAYTAVDLAETHQEEAARINDTAVGILARAASARGCRLVHLSTDFVFDGRSNAAYLTTDETRPLNVYGATKLEGERKALQLADHLVVRTSWVYASVGKNFVNTMLRLMRERDEIKVVCDQIGAPTWASSVAQAVWGLISAAPASGIYHWTDLGVAGWYDFAVAIQEEALATRLLKTPVSIVPISSSDYPTPARRPAFSVLNTQSTRDLIGAPAAHWRHNLRKMLDELRAA